MRSYGRSLRLEDTARDVPRSTFGGVRVDSSVRMAEKKRGAHREETAHAPTRKVGAMTAVLAEMLLREHDEQVDSPPPVPTSPEDSGQHADRVALDAARLIEVREDCTSSPPPPAASPPPSAVHPVGGTRLSPPPPATFGPRTSSPPAVPSTSSRAPVILALVVGIAVGILAAVVALTR